MWEHWKQLNQLYESRATSTTTFSTWPQAWSMWTLTGTTEGSWVPGACLSVVSLLSCPRLLHSSLHTWLITLWLKFVLRLIVIAMSHAHVEWLSLRPLHLPHFPSLHSLFVFLHFLLPYTFLFLDVVDLTKRTAAEEQGHPDNKNSSTGFEPNDHFITEAHVEFTQESVTKQRFFEDFDYDDVTIPQRAPKMSRSLWRRRPVVLSVVVVNESW